jgi:hypothetical protein
MGGKGKTNFARLHGRGILADLFDDLGRQVAVRDASQREIGGKDRGFEIWGRVTGSRFQRDS